MQGIAEHLTPVLYTKQNSVSPLLEVQQIDSNKSGGVPNAQSTSLNLGQRQRILQEIESLQQQYDLLSQKLSRLRLDLVIESGTVVKFQLEKQIENAEAERTQLTQRIEQLENSLQ